MKKERITQTEAVSPVVGVMLMLVVTIIIAAVVSGFAGGLASNTEDAPQLVMNVQIKNTGYASSSYILFDVQGVSESIPTKNLKITTSWTNSDGVRGGNTTAANLNAPNTVTGDYNYQSPLGFGTGVISESQIKTSGSYNPDQHFGNFSLIPGTTMKNSAYGYGSSYGYGAITEYKYTYTSSFPEGSIDGMQAILGGNWNATLPGDVVDVTITHIPSGKVIFEKSVVVEG